MFITHVHPYSISLKSTVSLFQQVMFWITKDRRPSYVPFRVPSDTDIITAAQAMTRNVQNAPPPPLVPEEDRY